MPPLKPIEAETLGSASARQHLSADRQQERHFVKILLIPNPSKPPATALLNPAAGRYERDFVKNSLAAISIKLPNKGDKI